MKVYRQSWRIWLGRFVLAVFFLGSGAGMLVFLKAVEIKALGLFSLLMGIYVFWFLIKTRERFAIRLDGDAVVFPSFTWWGEYRGKQVLWKNVLAVYTLSEFSSRETYVIPLRRTDDKDFDRAINQEIKKGKKSKKAREYLDYLKRTAQMCRVPRGIKNYRGLLKAISKRAKKASIDEDTKRHVQGKESLVLLSEGTRRVLRAIFQGERVGRRQSDTSNEKKRKRPTKKKRMPIVFIDKPAQPYWLALISLVFSFIIAGLLACRSYAVIGKPKKCGVMGIVMLASLIVAAGIYLFSTSDSINALVWINLMAGTLMAFLQQPDYLEYRIRQSIREQKKRGLRRYKKKKKARR